MSETTEATTATDEAAQVEVTEQTSADAPAQESPAETETSTESNADVAATEAPAEVPTGVTDVDAVADDTAAQEQTSTDAAAEQVIDTSTAEEQLAPEVEPKIVPTVGRIVHYWLEEPLTSDAQPEAAIITYVHDAFTVNLCVFDCVGAPRPQRLVTLSNGQESVCYPRAEWMPYQLQQAQK